MFHRVARFTLGLFACACALTKLTSARSIDQEQPTLLHPLTNAIDPIVSGLPLDTLEGLAGNNARPVSRGADAPDPTLLVDTQQGQVQGKSVSGVPTWLGIPFAQPPTGELRFQPTATPASSWESPRDCTSKQAPVCPQTDGVGLYGAQSEDCLYLNVFSAAPSLLNASAPVMVFLYGGSFIHGGISLFLYQAQQLAQTQNAVVVTANYRLGIFGWGASKAFWSDDWQSSGNYGLMDQIAALEWVADNIASFGGDPDNVMLFGESAGGISVCYHMVIPASAGLFRRALIESGPCVQGVNSTIVHFDLATDEAQTAEIFNFFGCDVTSTQTDFYDCMSQVTTEELLGQSNLYSWGVIIDGKLVERDPLLMWRDGPLNANEFIAGTNKDEGTLFTPMFQNDTAFDMAIALDLPKELAELVLEKYSPDYYGGSPFYAFAAIMGDSFFICPTRRMLRYADSHNVVTRRYEWVHQPSWDTCPGFFCSYQPLGAYHDSELYYVFGNNPPFTSFTNDEKSLSGMMQELWSGFAVDGSPANWPEFTEENGQYIVLNVTDTSVPTVDSFLLEHNCDFWDYIADQMQNDAKNGTYSATWTETLTRSAL